MELSHIKGVVEGLLFASGDEGITAKQIASVLGITDTTVHHTLNELKEDYNQMDRGVMIMQANHAFHLTTKPEHSSYYKKYLASPQSAKMSQAALETLAIIAYRQPITRTEIEDIRGVKSDRPVQTLVARSLIEEVGRREGIGRPILFSTTKDFLTYFGMTSLEELPPLPEGDEDLNQEADLFFGDELRSNN
ncbi:SMC-Scp complex subunit ScpB [Virgibacillus ihumii]|uniref:SMC-Scp complex subunit ScpB n=1 Tax=Virgibacillus ihumii TaxID=2686091 RepID=UPI00157BD374|nr:SMC-Scp complex subunit ScpB [Virgibacillus ihumii]